MVEIGQRGENKSEPLLVVFVFAGKIRSRC